MIAYTDQVEDEAIPLAGQYGGKLKIKTNQGEQIKIEKTNTKNVFRLTFFTKKMKKLKSLRIMDFIRMDLAMTTIILS